MKTEAQKKAEKKYLEKLSKKGIKQRSFRCTEQQFNILRVFFGIIKKIENLDLLTGIDISEDEKRFTLIFDDKINSKW